MAEQTTKQKASEQTDDGNGNGSEGNGHTGRNAAIAAAVAAAGGATAFAAKKALGGRSGSDQDDEKRSERKRGSDSDSMVGSMISSGWDAAKDSLLPLAEDAAGRVGEFAAKSTPEIVRDRIVPKFIEAFEEAHGD
jgi:hypothetical protein